MSLIGKKGKDEIHIPSYTKKKIIIENTPIIDKLYDKNKFLDNDGKMLPLNEAVKEVFNSPQFQDKQEQLDKIIKEKLLSRKVEKPDSGRTQVDLNIFKDLSAYHQGGGGGFQFGGAQDSLLKRKIIQYREMSRNPELEDIINDIMNECVVVDNYDYPVKLEIETNSNLVQRIKERTINKVYKSFNSILDTLNFDIDAPEIFRRWFIDGRLYIWRKRNENGDTIDYEVLDPLLLELVIDSEGEEEPFYVYYPGDDVPVVNEGYNTYATGWSRGSTEKVESIRIEYLDIIAIYSGKYDYLLKFYVSPIEKSLKILNQLTNLEDAMVLHQFIRAVQRRVFKLDTGSLNHKQSEKFINEVQRRHREHLSLKYNTEDGSIEGDEKVRFLSLFDDYWIAAREGDKTSIETLDGSGGEWETINDKLGYFRRKLYRAMKVPFNRYSNQENDGSEFKMAADSLERQNRKFLKYIHALRLKFNDMFTQLLEREILSNKTLDNIEWNVLKKRLKFVWEDDSFFTTLRKLDILSKQVEGIQSVGFEPSEFFTRDFVNKELLNRNDEEIAEIERMKAIEAEKYGTSEEGEGGPGGMGGPGEEGGLDLGGDFELPSADVGELPEGPEEPEPEPELELPDEPIV